MKKSVVPFVSVVAFAVIASNSVHAAGVNQDDLALAALTKLSNQQTATFTPAATPARVIQVRDLNHHVIGKAEVKAIISEQLKNSMLVAKNNILATSNTSQDAHFDELFSLLGADSMIASTATAMLTD